MSYVAGGCFTAEPPVKPLFITYYKLTFRTWEIDFIHTELENRSVKAFLLSCHSLDIFTIFGFYFSPLQEIYYRWDLWLIRELLKQHDQRALPSFQELKYFFSLNSA